ncbi:DEKNAAC100988 [Brettanomyces naardenensis]|uniref:DEKNAAC100988 n=1 Tax=Brettanomyces naardenensis TaxID=13370 RepID=A0A448YGN9_BRENA|nr:DEKNAAC100988 [Brettanomyces naardenensis]
MLQLGSWRSLVPGLAGFYSEPFSKLATGFSPTSSASTFSIQVLAEIVSAILISIILLFSAHSLETFSLLNSFTSQQNWAVQTQKIQNYVYINLEQIFPFSRELIANNKYDQRLPIASVYKQVQRELDASRGNIADLTIDFNWADWINLGHAHIILDAYNSLGANRGEQEYKKLWEALRSNDFDRNVHHPILSQLLHSDTWLDGFMDAPERIDIITDEGFYEVSVRGTDKRLGAQGLWDTYYGQERSDWSASSLTDLDLKRSAKQLDFVNRKYHTAFNWSEPIPERMDIPNEDMHWNLDEEIKKLEKVPNKTNAQAKHLERLKLCRDSSNDAMYFFPVNFLENDRYLKGDHTNFPFFQSIIDPSRHRSPIHHMMKNYARFMRQAGYDYWVFSGNAISWYFNGNNMPWDEDIDVRMSAQEMNRMSMTHNATLVVENPEDGDGLYYFMISPWFGKSTRVGNHIDSRFLDLRTGLYIDVTCLYEATEPVKEIIKHDKLFDYWKIPEKSRADYLKDHKALNDKNGNWFWEEHFTHHFRTLFEGTMVYMPYDYSDLLKYSYGDKVLTKLEMDSWRFIPEIQLWVSEKYCDLKKYKKVFKEGKAFTKEGKLTFAGACWNAPLLDEWNRVHTSTELHKKEMKGLIKGDYDHFEYSQQDLKVYWKDEFTELFDYYETSGDGNV